VWTEITREQYRRDGLRYASDTTDGEWSLIAAEPPSARKRGRPCTTPIRAVVYAICYLAQTGCQWRVSPIRRHSKSSQCIGLPRFYHDASTAIRHQMGPSGPILRTPSTRVKSIMIARPFLSGSALRSPSGAAAKTRSRSFSSVAIRAHP
jgi:Putative transposase of IS4/5 family (DUF4096)